MENKFAGYCFLCSKPVKKGEGHAQLKSTLPAAEQRRYSGNWVVRCKGCVGKGNTKKK